MLRVFLIILTLFVLSFGKVEIKKDGAFAKVIIDEPQRGDFNFVLFHNNNPIVINCAGGKCIKKVRLKNGKNFFEWKNKEGLSSQSEIVGGYATLKILDCKNHHPINSGEVLVNGKSFQIHSGEVKVYRWMEKSVSIDPRIKDYTTNGKIKKKLKLGIVEEICLYPKEYTLKVYDCKNNRLINSGSLIINEDNFKIQNGIVKIHKWFGRDIEISPRVQNYTANGKITKIPEDKKIDKICLYPKEYTLKVYDCKNNRLINSGSLIINEDNFKIQNGIVKIHKWFGRDIEISPRVKGFITKGRIKKIPKAGKEDIICLYPMKKIKKAEGAIGDPRFNITWPPSPQDIDIHVKTPCGKEIYYASKNKKQICKGYVGKLDVDILRKDCKRRRVACQENITFDSGGPRGEYKIVIEKYSGTNTPTPVILTIINNGEKKVYEVNLTRVQEKKVFKIIH